MHLDSPIVSNWVPVTLRKTNWLKDNNVFFLRKIASRSLSQRYPVGSRYKYIPNYKAEVSCNTHLEKASDQTHENPF